jgi:hypothetical protein
MRPTTCLAIRPTDYSVDVVNGVITSNPEAGSLAIV